MVGCGLTLLNLNHDDVTVWKGFPNYWPFVKGIHRDDSLYNDQRGGAFHYDDVIMGAMASQITSLTIVYSTVYSDTDQWKHQRPRHWPLCGEFTADRRIPHRNGQERGKCLHLMTSSCHDSFLILNKLLKKSLCRWFETLLRSCDVTLSHYGRVTNKCTAKSNHHCFR